MLRSSEDIEDTPVNIKKFAKAAQNVVRDSIPTDADYDQVLELLYKVHVQIITHGAVICGENPTCGECPLQSQCDYALKHFDSAAHPEKDKALINEAKNFRVLTAFEIKDSLVGASRREGDKIPYLLLVDKRYPTGEAEGRVLVSSWSAFDGVLRSSINQLT